MRRGWRAGLAPVTLLVLLFASAGGWLLLARGHPGALPGRLSTALRLGLSAGCFLLPAGGLALDLLGRFRATPWLPGNAGEARRLWVAAVATARVASILFPAIAWFRPGPRLPRDPALLVWGWTLWGNLLVCLGSASALMGLMSLGRLARRVWAEPALLALALWAGLVGLLHAGLSRSLASHGWSAWVMALAPAALAVAYLFWVASGMAHLDDECALDLLLRP